MSRATVRRDLRRKPQTFVLGDREMALVVWYMKEHDLNKSQAVRAIFALAEGTLNGNEIREIANHRRDLAAQAREQHASKRPEPACPSCGDTDLYVALSGGRWRCDNCMASG